MHPEIVKISLSLSQMRNGIGSHGSGDLSAEENLQEINTEVLEAVVFTLADFHCHERNDSKQSALHHSRAEN